MEINLDKTEFRYYAHDNWRPLDTKTGLPVLDEGLFFHFKETRTGVVGSIRTKRWWGAQVVYWDSFAQADSPERVQRMACDMAYRFKDGTAHNAYKARMLRRSKKQAKYMGSYEGRSVYEVDGV